MEVEILLCDSDLEILKSARSSFVGTTSETTRLKLVCETGRCTVEVLKDIHSFNIPSLPPVHRLVEKGQVIIPTLPVPKRNADLEKRIQRLRVDLENKQYKEMVKDVDASAKMSNCSEAVLSIGQEYRIMNKQLTLVVNTVLTVVGAFVAAFFGSKYLFDGDVAQRIIISVLSAFLVLLTDLYFISVTLD